MKQSYHCLKRRALPQDSGNRITYYLAKWFMQFKKRVVDEHKAWPTYMWPSPLVLSWMMMSINCLHRGARTATGYGDKALAVQGIAMAWDGCVLCVWICKLGSLEYDVWNGWLELETCTKTCWLLYYICSLACICHTTMLSKGCVQRWEKWEDFEPEFCIWQIWCWIRWIFSLSMDCSFSWNGRWQKIPPKWKLELLTETSHFSFQPFVFSAMSFFFWALPTSLTAGVACWRAFDELEFAPLWTSHGSMSSLRGDRKQTSSTQQPLWLVWSVRFSAELIVHRSVPEKDVKLWRTHTFNTSFALFYEHSHRALLAWSRQWLHGNSLRTLREVFVQWVTMNGEGAQAFTLRFTESFGSRCPAFIWRSHPFPQCR